MDIQQAYERVREHVGRTYRREVGEIREVDIQRFAAAVGDELPVTMDLAVAAAAGLPAIAAPPLFLSAVTAWDWGPRESELRPDGASEEQLGHVPVEGLRLMGGGQSLEFLRPVVAGTKVVEETHVSDVRLKEGRSGRLLLIEVERVFRDDDGPLTRCIETFIGR